MKRKPTVVYEQIRCDIDKCWRVACCHWQVDSVNGFQLSPTSAHLCALHRKQAKKLTEPLTKRMRSP